MERLQKILANRQVASRRKAEQLIEAGRVTVNGVTAVLGQRADPEEDTIAVDGTVLACPPQQVYLLLNKPRGYMTTLSDERGRKTVADLVSECPCRVYPVGRLDFNSEGLLLLTNDGELTQKLTHPSHQVEKEYLVRVSGDVAAAVPILQHDMVVEGIAYRGAKVQVLPSQEKTGLLSVTICQGKNRQVRNMCAGAGLKVLRLKRVREGSLQLGTLGAGCWRYLTKKEADELKSGI